MKKELDNLFNLGIILKQNNIFRLNEKCIFINDLKNILIKTDFIYFPIQKSFQGKKIKFAFVFGSFANGTYSMDSDVDLMVIGEIKLGEVYNILEPIEKVIKKDVNPVVWIVDNLIKEKETGFVKDIFKKKIIILKGDENELRRIIKK